MIRWVLSCMLGVFATRVDAGELDRARTGPMPLDPAPALIASRWLRGEPVRRFEPDHVYVVDLWATWCPPCLASMPHMSRLQARYGRDVTVVAMNVWEMKPGRVPALVQSLGDSMAVSVAMDSIPAGKDANEGLTAVAYLGKTEFSAMSRAYLVDRKGRVAWIGTTRELDEPLARVLDGTWDPEPFAKSYTANMEIELTVRNTVSHAEAAIAAKDWDRAYGLCEEFATAQPALAPRIANPGFVRLAMAILALENPGAEAIAVARRAAERALELRPDAEWGMSRIAADAARAAGDNDSARGHLQRAIEKAPAKERPALTAALEALPK